jgi:predicted nucleic acid-binding protein
LRRIVLDASVALAWCFDDEDSPYAKEILGLLRTAEAFVPPIWPLEVSNALLAAERRKRLTESDSKQFLRLIEGLGITIDAPSGFTAVSDTLALARKHGLTAYDAAYLELASRLGVKLATLDHDLAKAAAKMSGLAGEAGS